MSTCRKAKVTPTASAYTRSRVQRVYAGGHGKQEHSFDIQGSVGAFLFFRESLLYHRASDKAQKDKAIQWSTEVM